MDNQQLTNLSQKLNGNLDRLIEELSELRKENVELKDQLSALKTEFRDFKKSHKIANIVKGIDPEGKDAERLKARIDENIQELDKCIALLSDK